MLRAFKTEICLIKEQCIKINQTIGNCRFIYNYFISLIKNYMKHSYESSFLEMYVHFER